MGSGAMPLIRWAAAAVLLGALGGVAWRFLARPGVVAITPDGAVTTELEAMHQFGAIVTYLAIGAVVSFVWGGALALAEHHHGWRLVPFVVVVTIGAALAARAVGLALTPDKIVVPKTAKIGDTIPGILTMDAWSAVGVWAVFGLAGLLLATWFSSPVDE